MNNALSKVEKENPSRRVPSPDGVVAYHAALSRSATRVQIPVGAPLGITHGTQLCLTMPRMSRASESVL